ncbi:MAG TPA: molybdenum cofactor biosynthesis protein MoaE [Bacteroidetes bacterium]|jgi:molybdopterin synthase catalytic subunit|nr:molybdenum cofactor biosynthesis protein MoaE [Bacteroidota bacterium]
MVSVTATPIDVEEIIRTISSPRAGGIDIFIGTVRNHSQGKRVRQLEYSAYVPMAENVMKEIEEEIKAKWIVDAVAIVHRVGVLQVGDVAVVTAVSAPHRKEAFEACRHAIERVKEVVPIWKKEHFEEGLAWVVGQHEVDIKSPEL